MDSTDLGIFDIDAYSHYAKTLNGSIYTVVPGKVMLFPSPVNLPDSEPWMDFSGGVRHFSASFYADLLSSEFNVFLVACVDSTEYDRAAFAAHGIETEDMPLDGCNFSCDTKESCLIGVVNWVFCYRPWYNSSGMAFFRVIPHAS